MRNLDYLLSKILQTVHSHNLGEIGRYCRWLWQNEAGDRELGLNEYGCADAANILYTLDCFPTEPEIREKWIGVLQDLQDAKSGMFTEVTHHPIHTTAHCVAALELFDATPKYPIFELAQYQNVDEMQSFLEHLDWKNDPWNASHQGAGLYAAMKLSGMTELGWEQAYFDWLYDNQDPETGMWKRGCAQEGPAPMPWHLAGSFHYLFNLEYAKAPIRYCRQMVDTCLEIRTNGVLGRKLSDPSINYFGRRIGFLEVDWVYVLSRACQRVGYRTDDCKEAIRNFADDYIDWLCSLDHNTHDSFNDLHLLFGSCCALAEIQQFLPGEYESWHPLRLVLDRRPFI